MRAYLLSTRHVGFVAWPHPQIQQLYHYKYKVAKCTVFVTCEGRFRKIINNQKILDSIKQTTSPHYIRFKVTVDVFEMCY